MTFVLIVYIPKVMEEAAREMVFYQSVSDFGCSNILPFRQIRTGKWWQFLL